MDELPLEVIRLLFGYLPTDDLLRVRMVNRRLFDAVSLECADRIIYNFTVGGDGNSPGLHSLLQAKFPYVHFRVHVEKQGSCALPGYVNRNHLALICSGARSVEFLGGGVRCRFFRLLVKAASRTLETLKIDGYDGRSLGSFFKAFVNELPIHLPALEQLQLRAKRITDADLFEILGVMPNLRTLSLAWPSEQRRRPYLELHCAHSQDPEFSPSSVHHPSNTVATVEVLIGLIRRFCHNLKALDVAQLLTKPCALRDLLREAAIEPRVHFEELCIDPADFLSDSDIRAIFDVASRLISYTGIVRMKHADDLEWLDGVGQDVSVLCVRDVGVLDMSITSCLGYLRGKTGIKELHVNKNDLFNRLDLRSIAILDLDCLESLNLDNTILLEPASSLARFESLAAGCGRTLTCLSLVGMQEITDDVMPAILTGLPRLQKLSLERCTRLTDNGLSRPHGVAAGERPALRDLTELVALNLGDVNISDVTLRRGLKNRSLKILIVRNTQVTDDGLHALVRTAKNLQYLNAEDCMGLTDAGVARFLSDARGLKRMETQGNPYVKPETLMSLNMPPWPHKYERGLF